MKFEVAKLVELCDFLIAAATDHESRRLPAYAEYKAAHVEQWKARYLQDWREYRDTITKALRSGNVIHAKDMRRTPPVYMEPQGGNRYFSWHGESFNSVELSKDLEYATRLRGILSVCSDINITLTELKSLGYGSRELIELIKMREEHKAREEAQKKRKQEDAAMAQVVMEE